MARQASDHISLGVGEAHMPRGRHICYVFSDDDERFRMLARYFRAGVDDGDKLFYIADELTPDELRRRFADVGADFGAEPRCSVLCADELYCLEGGFNPSATIERLAQLPRAAFAEGFEGARGAGEMAWALRGLTDADRLLEYEVMLNGFFESPEAAALTAMCLYDARLYDGAMILALLDIHPFILIRGQILRNPNYMRAGEALPRGSSRMGAAA